MQTITFNKTKSTRHIKNKPAGYTSLLSSANDKANIRQAIILLGTKGECITVDEEDYNFLRKYRWYVCKHTKTHYAKTVIKENGGKHKTVFMHRLLLNAPKGYEVDHINHNGLDNRKNNLRLCTSEQNNWNSQYKQQWKGYSLIDGKYCARISVKNHNVQLGSFDTSEKAHQAYLEAVKFYRNNF